MTVDENGRVIELSLSGNQLSGAIPPELGGLANLETLNLRTNQLSGAIPMELGNLTNLQWLGLYDNQLSGAIPAELGQLAILEVLALYDNQLTGPIPVELGNLANLQYLGLQANQLSGSIPVELGQLANLHILVLQDNQLTGPIPPDLGLLASLTGLWLGNNQLSGLIPPELGNLAALTTLALHQNNLSGPIPRELGNLASLGDLNLWGNNLSGSIPSELGNLTNLWQLSLGFNNLMGPIPSELANIGDALVVLDLPSNNLTGPIPVWIGDLANLEVLNLAGNDLTGSIPTELSELIRLRSLDLSGNDLTGPIPVWIGDLIGQSFLVNPTMSNSAIQAVLKDLAPGDELVFEAGTYRNLNLSTARDGSKTRKIRLRAADRGSAVFSGPTRLQIDHKHTVLDGIYFKEVNSFGKLPIIGIRNDHFRITHCAFVALNENGEQENLGRGIGPANQFIVTEVALPPSRIYVPQFTRIDHCVFIRGPRAPVVQHMIELTNSLENERSLKAYPDGFFAENPGMSLEIGKPMYYRVDHCFIAINTAAFRTSRFGNFAFSGKSDEVDPEIRRLLNIPDDVPNADISTDLLKKYFRTDNRAAGVFDNNFRVGHRTGDPEDIVSKSSYNVYLNNTFLNNKGHLSLRKGSHETVMHNFFIYEDDYKGPRGYHLLARSVDHVFVKNYFQNGHLGLESGQVRMDQSDQALAHKIRYEDEDWTFGENGHATVRRALVAGNTFVFTDGKNHQRPWDFVRMNVAIR